MALLGHDRYCDEVLTQTGLLRDLVKGSDLSLTVPTCPDWSLAELLRHIGGNLRSVETAVRSGTPVTAPDKQVPGLAGPGDDDPAALDAWLAEAAARFADTLRAAGPTAQAQVWTFQLPTAFWARRAAHDLVIHRADAIDELLELISDPEIAASSPGLAELRGPGKRSHLHPTDADPELAAEWLIELGQDGFSWRHTNEPATVTLRGPLADVLRVFYRRLPADSERVEVLGDPGLLDFWLERVSLR